MGVTLMWLDASTAFPSFTGPIAKALSASDLSDLIGGLVGACVYVVLARSDLRRAALLADGGADPEPAAAEAEAVAA